MGAFSASQPKQADGDDVLMIVGQAALRSSRLARRTD
jgi:hypothetical protein